jgi:large subunit ribosomal protein L21
MYAVIKAGGKQHRVKPGDVIEVELMHADGESVQFHPLLVVDDENKTHVGKEAAKAVVTAKLVGEQKGEKVKIFKYRPKTGYSRRQGHRQMMTLVEIGEIKLPGARKAAPTEEAASDKPAAKPRAKAPAKSTATSPAKAPAREPATASDAGSDAGGDE